MIGFDLPPGCFVRLSERQIKIAERLEHILGRRRFPNSDGVTFMDRLLLRGVCNEIGNIVLVLWKSFRGLLTVPLLIFRSSTGFDVVEEDEDVSCPFVNCRYCYVLTKEKKVLYTVFLRIYDITSLN